ncbi:hypothetical protein Poli38472_006192 [Pythium oligandrum]|uniref:Uncharacterized protein n=1 Tax=Pythium oligandrum TaxID=41045 RepID=A0A8K1CSF9_PYTOL|nr:hypothetical protein Poli38472_006192 [Pythium oligandrum]|eukprot:TMW68724.1 hypothetical protein Poli38472_006192 [Pythium oligandrum]
MTRLTRWLALLVSSTHVVSVVMAHPTLVQCVCNTTLALDAVIRSPTPAGKGQAAKYAVPSCINDVFAETGIRWYTNGPVRGDIKYWRKATIPYSTGRAAQHLISLGYRCEATELYDPNEIIYYT